MSSVLVKGMAMPKDCYMCPMCHRAFDGNETRLACYALKTWCFEEDGKLDNCPLVEVKNPHGRLIDADALIKALIRKEPFSDCARVVIAECMEEVRHAPTVIEIEAEGETWRRG